METEEQVIVENNSKEEEKPKYKVKLQEGQIIDPNEVYEDDTIIYTPINALKFNWDLYSHKQPETIKKIKEDYEEEKHKYNIIGLVVYKHDGGWCWSGTDLLTPEEKGTPMFECSPCMLNPE